MRLFSVGLILAGVAIGILALSGCGSEADLAAPGGAETETSEKPLVQDRYNVTKSAFGHDQTMSRLLEALDRRELTVFAVIDHAAGAESVGAAMPPTTLVIFGNPRAGTPLINAHPLLGIELPLRALVYEREGETFLALSGIGNLERTYPLKGQEQILDRMRRLTTDLTKEVTAQ